MEVGEGMLDGESAVEAGILGPVHKVEPFPAFAYFLSIATIIKNKQWLRSLIQRLSSVVHTFIQLREG